MIERQQMLRDWLNIDLQMPIDGMESASEDASFRRYYRIFSGDKSYIVMDAPPDKENCEAFLDVTRRLLSCDINVPRIFAQDLDLGFLLLGDLGTDLYLDKLDEDNVDRLYGVALNELLKIQTHASVENLPKYSESLLIKEMSLFRDWLLFKHLELKPKGNTLQQLEELFILLARSASLQTKVFVHRDFHSRNLLIAENCPGIIDYQDAVLGPVSYDLVSLLKDCYIKWPQEKIEQWTRVYYKQLAEVIDLRVTEKEFERSFDLMGVQRHLKASGIFARLNHRDHKPDYMKDIPRTLSYIVDLADKYPELDSLIVLIEDSVWPAMEFK